MNNSTAPMVPSYFHDGQTSGFYSPNLSNIDLANLGEFTAGFQPSAALWANDPLAANSQFLPYASSTTQQISAVTPSRYDAWDPVSVTGLAPGSARPSTPPPFSKRPRLSRDSENMSDVGDYITSYLFSDSGYATRSIGTRSVAGVYPVEQQFENSPSTNYPDTYLPIVRSPTPTPAPASPVAPQRETEEGGRPLQPKAKTRPRKAYECPFPDCDWIGKTRSDLKKHTDRHEKRFKCDVPNCKRKDGFATSNDLNRHLKAVHKSGMGKIYRCFVRGCAKSQKDWLRLDNFRAHLQNVHKDCNVGEMVRLGMNPERMCFLIVVLRTLNQAIPLPNCLLTPPTSSQSAPLLPQLALYLSKPSPPIPGLHSPSIPKQQRQHSVLLLFMLLHSQRLDSRTNHVPQRSMSKVLLWTILPFRWRIHLCLKKVVQGLFKALEKAMEKSRRQNSQGPQNNNASDKGDESHNPSFLDLLSTSGKREREFFHKLIQNSYTQLMSKSTAGGGNEPNSSNAAADNSQSSDKKRFKCPQCPTTTRLQCEMTKHMKRHTRPYGCTFTNCDKVFGSKSDWKRHENATHFQLESWRCQEPEVQESLDTRECARQFFRSGQFASHLRNDHGLDECRIWKCLRTNRIGRNGQGRFWCGFCRKLVESEPRGSNAWKDRINHIDVEHFRKGQSIEDWLLPSGHFTKGEVRRRKIESSLGSGSGVVVTSTDTPANAGISSAGDDTSVSDQQSRDVDQTRAVNPFRTCEPSQSCVSENFKEPSETSSRLLMSPTASFSQYDSSTQRQSIADSLMPVVNPVQRVDPREDQEQCVTCCQCGLSYTLALENRCTVCMHRPCGYCAYGKSND
ncbi:uncharacterized protein CIMG_02219 [Coccidioides immitis RS]|uniref:C2H2-type domain-containing protein n=3 Tax=Coccidioides immitis TaxID=5501 RepID=J3KKX3_COCIM|nr:uncharacterized protein CIMG_02219 [Coccidioides immitis RS]EAS36865.3 hypothetical protein CIMG_02219 [Coccidioides immitis RS]KMP09778.1 hypothetical protein CIRG_09011 [Coccidioides immitis RMSCC 2394]